MNRKINVLIVTQLLVFVSFVFIFDDLNVEASSGGDGTSVLDSDFIYNNTYNLSWAIFEAYNSTDLRKGRYFGSKGDHYAAESLADEMTNLNLWDPTTVTYPT